MNKNFTFNNTKFKYFLHGYNTTWLNERIIEIPIILSFISPHKRILEVGNVLSHYTNVTWDILDKFEKIEGVINADVVNYKPKDRYDLIISISTLEHVGFDDDEYDGHKIVEAITNLRNICLKKGGKMIITLPIGYNKKMDLKIFTNKLFFDDTVFMKRISKRNEWKEVKKNEVIRAKYEYPFKYGANAICIGVLKK